MDFISNTARHIAIKSETVTLMSNYPHDLQMYDVPPIGDMPFIEFQQLGLERLKVLQTLEGLFLRTDFTTADERKKVLCSSLKTDGLRYFANLMYGVGCKSNTEADLQARRKDCISHFILRLAYCRDREQANWFVNQETELFKLRYTSLDDEGVEKLLTMHNLKCIRISQEEKDGIREDLYDSSSKITSIDTTEFYKVPFFKVIDLVKARKVYLSGGIAYISQVDLVSYCTAYFKKKLLADLESAKECVAYLCDDERLMTFINTLPNSFVGMNKVVWTSTATPIDKLEELSKTSYPLCMRVLHEALRMNHHLKNSGRIQYGLFIKGIGVTLEDALRFWKGAFSQKVDGDKFEKQYAYSIRHIFGKEGKRTNYTPLSCNKIIHTDVGSGEYNGCPYRNMDKDSLTQKLLSYGCPAASVTEIVNLAKERHYFLACTKFFEVTHKCLPEKPFIHPNAYFAESRNILIKDTDMPDNTEVYSQGTGMKFDRYNSTPSRKTEVSNVTPSRTNERSFTTPLRQTDHINTTPSRSVGKGKRLSMQQLLTDVEISELMNEEM